MKIENPIGWCDDTTNAVTGCDKVSAGCKNCYAATGTRARVLRALGIETWGPNGVRHPVKEYATKLKRLNNLCVCDKCHESAPIRFLGQPHYIGNDVGTCRGTLRRIRLFADSNSDFLDKKWPIETLAEYFDAIRQAPNVDVLLLTKRAENFRSRLQAARDEGGENNERSDEDFVDFINYWIEDDKAPANLWLGVSVENQAMADKRIPELHKIPAAVRFLSCEPLLESIHIRFSENCSFCGNSDGEVGRCVCGLDTPSKIDWVIVGGESGSERRDCGVEAIVNVAGQCVSAGVPVYVKQDTSLINGAQGRIPDAIWNLKQFPTQR